MKAPRSSGRMPMSEPLKARPIGLRTASTITASGMREVSLSGQAAVRRRGTLGDEHQFSVRRVLLAAPRFARPVERKRLALDLQLTARGQLDQARVGGFGLVARDVSQREADDRERLAAYVSGPQGRLGAGRLAELYIAGRIARSLDGELSGSAPERINDDIEGATQIQGLTDLWNRDDCVRPQLADGLERLGVTGCRHDVRGAEDLRRLHGYESDDSGGAEHQHALAAAHVGAPLDSEPTGQSGDAERGGQRVVGAVGQHDRLLLVGQRVLGERSTRRWLEPDLRARLQPVALDHAANGLAPHYVRNVRRAAVELPERDRDVDRVERRRRDLHERLTLAALRLGRFADHRRLAELLDEGGPHFGGMRRAPSSRIVSPFSIWFSAMWTASCANSRGSPRRDGWGMAAPSAVRDSSGSAAKSGVSNVPGAIVQTRIPTRARSRAAGSVRPAMPAFEAEYAVWPIWPSKAAIEAVMTTAPRSPSASGSAAAIAVAA